MTKLIHIADLHFSNSHPYSRINIEKNINERFLFQLEIFDYICNYAFDNKIGYILISGDIFHTCNPTSRERSVAFNLFSKWINKGIEFIIIEGNHDSNGIWGSLQDIKHFNLVSFNIGTKHISYFTIGTFHITLAPFKSYQSLKDITDFNKENPDIFKDILMLHDSIYGGDYGIGFIKSDEGFDTKSLFNLGYKYIAMGHFHKFQVWENKCQSIIYSGSIMARDFKEFDSQQKYFIELTYNNENITYKPIEIPLTHEFIKIIIKDNILRIQFNASLIDIEIKDTWEFELDKYELKFKNSIIKIIYPKNTNFTQNNFIEKLKKYLEDADSYYIILEPILVQQTQSQDLSPGLLNFRTLLKEYCELNHLSYNDAIELIDIVEKGSF